MEDKEQTEELSGFKRISDKKLLKGLIIALVIFGYLFLFMKVVFLK